MHVYVKCIAALIYTCAGEKMTVAVLIMLVISVGSTAAFPFNGKYVSRTSKTRLTSSYDTLLLSEGSVRIVYDYRIRK